MYWVRVAGKVCGIHRTCGQRGEEGYNGCSVTKSEMRLRN